LEHYLSRKTNELFDLDDKIIRKLKQYSIIEGQNPADLCSSEKENSFEQANLHLLNAD